MWLLSTDRAELHFFSSPEAIDGGYAILSHTWGRENEMSFQEVQALSKLCAASGQIPRELVPPKIRECCRLAESQGHYWVWIDTCCIDKTSSTEHSEAINSMFHWYACAEVCYAFLEDVPTHCDLHANGSKFRTARWHTRGWTLQELIAPTVLVYVSQDWQPLGTKLELASLLQQITGVWWQVLTGEFHYTIISVAQRMSWASNRYTTRMEDEAYCLMGLFNVNMPTIYGEGRQAFQRLQQEIMKQSFDTSLFAWGRWVLNENLVPMSREQIYQKFNTSSQNHVYLLATSPRNFHRPFNGNILRFTPSTTYPLQPYLPWQWKAGDNEPEDSTRRTVGPFGSLELPRFAFTSYGVKCRFPIVEVDGLTIAVLLCDTGRLHVGLILHPSNAFIRDPSRTIYQCGHGFQTNAGGVHFGRLISLGDDLYNLRFNGKTVTAEWRDIFIADSAPPHWKDRGFRVCAPLNCILPAPPFRVPNWLMGRMIMLNLEPRPIIMQGNPKYGNPFVGVLTFEDVDAKEGLRIFMGMCTDESSDCPRHWAKVWPQYCANWDQKSDFTHVCAEHHLESWKDWMKEFGDAERKVRLSFSRCSVSPKTTFVVHLELEGSVYERILNGKKVILPPRGPLLQEEDSNVSQAPRQETASSSTAQDIASPGEVARLRNPTLICDEIPAVLAFCGLDEPCL